MCLFLLQTGFREKRDLRGFESFEWRKNVVNFASSGESTQFKTRENFVQFDPKHEQRGGKGEGGQGAVLV